MATNIELEKQLIAAKKEISDLRGEVDALKTTSAAAVSAELATLRKILDATFRNAGLGNDWYQAKAVNRPAAEIATQMFEDRKPTPTSVVHTLSDLQEISQEIFGTKDLRMTAEKIEKVKQLGGKE